jgi:hypothetical protein
MNLLPAEGPGHCPSRKCRCHELNDLLEIYNKLRAFEFSVHTGSKTSMDAQSNSNRVVERGVAEFAGTTVCHKVGISAAVNVIREFGAGR